MVFIAAKKIEFDINALDLEILKLLVKRVELLKELGYENARFVLRSRLNRFLDDVAQHYALPRDSLALLLSYIDGFTLQLLKPLSVGFLGPRGSFTEEAAIKIFSDLGARLVSYNSIQDVFKAVEAGEIDYGVVPLENSLEGSVGETLDMLTYSNVKICGETELRISHCLIAKPGTKLEDIEIVLSHPMALAQCRSYISNKLKNVRIETRASTAEAVKEAVSRERVAAIGSALAAKLYGGEIIASGIEDNRENYTRFIAIGFKPLDKGVETKTSIIFTVKNVPGALYKALEPFAVRGINLSKIESRPIKGRPWEYMFFVDFAGSIEDAKVVEALEDVKRVTTSMKILGSYKRIV